MKPKIFNNTYCLYDYSGFIAMLIQQFKYANDLAIGKFFANKMYKAFNTLSTKYDAIIPMPLHKKRLQQRTFNQVMELLRIIKKESRVDYNSCVRIKNTQTLIYLSPVERKKELRGAFIIKHQFNYKKILIVDDIITTTSSVLELAKTINNSYGQQKPIIDILTLARTK